MGLLLEFLIDIKVKNREGVVEKKRSGSKEEIKKEKTSWEMYNLSFHLKSRKHKCLKTKHGVIRLDWQDKVQKEK